MNRVRNIGMGAVGALILIGSIIAGSLVWLMLTNPVTIANAVTEQDVSPFITTLGRAILDALMGLLKYL
ncbi:MAG TPA: hypothetical protein VJP86_04485 [Vicinamibacterales bacterium]|jgi:hypothetical protein|nr:hypothetical protein [Vicinamibacterales bacterium]